MKEYKCRGWLFIQYWILNKSTRIISKELNCGDETIRKWMIKFEIPRRSCTEQPMGEKSHNWKGGKRLRRGGYIEIYAPDHPHAKDRYVREHRLVIEAFLILRI